MPGTETFRNVPFRNSSRTFRERHEGHGDRSEPGTKCSLEFLFCAVLFCAFPAGNQTEDPEM
eukprot:scaffold129926_cov48-Phaeocystis_antarctica.AAC.1